MRSMGDVLDRHPVWGDGVLVVAGAALGILVGGVIVSGYRGSFDLLAGWYARPLILLMFMLPLLALPSIGSLITLRLITGEAIPRLTVLVVNMLLTGIMAHLFLPAFF